MILKQPAENLDENKAASEPMELSSDEDEEEGENGLSSYLDQAENCIYEFLDQTPKLSGRFSTKIKAIGYAEVCFT